MKLAISINDSNDDMAVYPFSLSLYICIYIYIYTYIYIYIYIYTYIYIFVYTIARSSAAAAPEVAEGGLRQARRRRRLEDRPGRVQGIPARGAPVYTMTTTILLLLPLLLRLP